MARPKKTNILVDSLLGERALHVQTKEDEWTKRQKAAKRTAERMRQYRLSRSGLTSAARAAVQTGEPIAFYDVPTDGKSGINYHKYELCPGMVPGSNPVGGYPDLLQDKNRGYWHVIDPERRFAVLLTRHSTVIRYYGKTDEDIDTLRMTLKRLPWRVADSARAHLWEEWGPIIPGPQE